MLLFQASVKPFTKQSCSSPNNFHKHEVYGAARKVVQILEHSLFLRPWDAMQMPGS